MLPDRFVSSHSRLPSHPDGPSHPTAPRTRAEILAHILWCGLALAVAVKAIVSPDRHTVWPVFATASDHWRAGKPLYVDYLDVDMYRYSPSFAVVVTPLALLPMRFGGCLWGLGSLALSYVGLRALYRDVLADRPGLPDRGVFLLVAAVGVGPMVWNLQSNTLLLGLLTLGTAATARQRWWSAAWFLAAAVSIKVWPLAWAAVVVVGQLRSLGWRLAVALAGLLAIPALTAPPEQVAQSYKDWWYILGVGEGYRWPGYRDLLTILQQIDLTVNPHVYRVAQVAAGFGVLLAALSATRQTGDVRRGLGVGLGAWLCWQLILGPGSERNTYGLIVPLIGWEVIRARQDGRSWWWPGTALAVILLFTSGDVERSVCQWLPAAKATLPMAVLGFAAWLLHEGLQTTRPTASIILGPWAVRRRAGREMPRVGDSVGKSS